MAAVGSVVTTVPRMVMVSRVRTMPKGARYETPTVPGVHAAGKDAADRRRFDDWTGLIEK